MKMLYISKVRITLYLLFFIVGTISIVVFSLNQNTRLKKQGQAEQIQTVDTQSVAPFSETSFQNGTTSVDLYVNPGSKEPLYTTEKRGVEAVYEFMRENPTVETVQDQTKSVQGAQSATPPRRPILPKDFDKNSRLVRRLNERTLPKRIARDVDHYYYNQTVQGVPVYGAVARFDVKADNQIVGVEGDLLTNTILQTGELTKEDAIKIALRKAASANTHDEAIVCPDRPVEKIVVNKKLLGLSSEDKNEVTWSISVCNNRDPITFDSTYYISSQSGEVVLQNEHVITVKNRVIYNCGSGTCRQARTEGQATVGDTDVDQSYDIVGNMYDYIFNTYQRDSFDNRGSTINAKTRYSAFQCPNAAWNGREMLACPGMVASDVWGHELFHGITQYTSGLMYQYQSGTLNESFSDIFGFALDSDNWTMGETTSIGVIRRLDDPTRGRTPQPDRLFSTRYYCGSGDNGGVHINDGILNKAFYLMTAGGSFNGCTISPLGKEKTLPIMFKADTVYLQPSANFKDAYDAVMKSCGDLYGLDSADCQTVKAALQATEMDQQPARTQTAAYCSRLSPQTPACAGVAPQPTSSIAPSVAPSATNTPTGRITPTSLPQPTSPPGQFEYVKTVSYSDECSSSTATEVKYKRIIVECKSGFQFSSTLNECMAISELNAEAERLCRLGPPTPTENPTLTPSENNLMALTFRIRLQGVLKIPSGIQSIPVKVTVAKADYSYERTKTITFTSNVSGIWEGSDTFDAPAGSGYVILIKGPMHIQKKIGHLTPSEPQPGTYRAGRSTISLAPISSILDFSGIVMLTGDLPDQDGVVNSYDISLIRNNIGKSDAQTTRLCDVNFDGVCNTQDHSLVIAALAVRTDEE